VKKIRNFKKKRKKVRISKKQAKIDIEEFHNLIEKYEKGCKGDHCENSIDLSKLHKILEDPKNEYDKICITKLIGRYKTQKMLTENIRIFFEELGSDNNLNYEVRYTKSGYRQGGHDHEPIIFKKRL